jgi:hypothetical protein
VIGGWGGKSGETAGSSTGKPGIQTTENPGVGLHLPLHSNRIAGSRFKKEKAMIMPFFIYKAIN